MSGSLDGDVDVQLDVRGVGVGFGNRFGVEMGDDHE